MLFDFVQCVVVPQSIRGRRRTGLSIAIVAHQSCLKDRASLLWRASCDECWAKLYYVCDCEQRQSLKWKFERKGWLANAHGGRWHASALAIAPGCRQQLTDLARLVAESAVRII
jgi:hypothetical protein